MKRDHDDPGECRTATDASLSTERATADATVARAVANAEPKLEALMLRDRVLADQEIMRFRRSIDDRLADERSESPDPSSQVVEERLAADAGKKAERSVADAVFEHERQRADERGATKQEKGALQAEYEAQRQSTNEHLSDERREANVVAADRDASESALEVALSAEVDRAEVFAMVAHDLRNPLCAILGNAELIVEHTEDSLTREAAGDITRAAARMGRLLTDLLDVARIDAGTFPLTKQRQSASALLSEVHHSYRPEFDSRGIDLSVAVPPVDIEASFDYDRVVQMLSNLLGNAMKFTPRGGKVGLYVEHDAEELLFMVVDDGAGIEPNTLPHLFERFWQCAPDTRRGLGLGLYLCRTIARAHGGDISVHSEIGAGSTFRICLPMS